ncbi:MAG: phosphatase PAP2 family protein [Patescibacteria group bacterium]|nr:phosphatase PAP2 family protein [Patescibacteria group bacterium]
MDIYFFRLINNLAEADSVLGLIGIYSTRYLIYLLAILAIVFLIVVFKKKERWWNTTRIFLSTVFAYIISQLIGFLYFRPRPFALLDGVNELIKKSPFEKSFPSDHTTGAFAIAFAVFLLNKKWGSVFLVIACLIGFSRIFVGVHYPLDVLAGILVGFLGAVLARWVVGLLDKKR